MPTKEHERKMIKIYLSLFGPLLNQSLVWQAKITTTATYNTFCVATKIQEQCFRLTMRQIIDKRLEQRVSIDNRIE